MDKILLLSLDLNVLPVIFFFSFINILLFWSSVVTRVQCPDSERTNIHFISFHAVTGLFESIEMCPFINIRTEFCVITDITEQECALNIVKS